MSEMKIHLDNLKFDSQNPRLPTRLQGVTDERQIIDYMVKFGNIIELMLSIAETGYSEAEPLLVVKDADGRYIVVEGNRRLAALKLLNNPKLTKIRINSIEAVISEARHLPKDIPVIQYDERRDVLDYLGYRHITGVKDWGALEKARYLDQLYKIHIKNTDPKKIYQKLARMIGSRSDYVFKLHTALMLYEKANENAYYGADISEEDINFSWITTALGYTGVSNFLGLNSSSSGVPLDNFNEENFKKVFTWMFNPGKIVIKESRQISELAKITEYPKAVERLERGSTIDEALLYTSAPNDAFIEMLKRAKQQLKQAKDAIEQLSEEPSESKELLDDIEKLVKTIIGALAANFNSTKDETSFVNELSSNPEALEILKKLLERQI